MNLLTRVELMWRLPTHDACVPARDVIGKQHARIDHLVGRLLTEEHDVPTIEGLTKALCGR